MYFYKLHKQFLQLSVMYEEKMLVQSDTKKWKLLKNPTKSLLFLRACSLNSFISSTHALYIKTLHKHIKNSQLKSVIKTSFK